MQNESDYIRLGFKRRITEQLLLHWNQLRGDRHFPEVNDIVPESITDVWDDCFLVEIDRSKPALQFDYIHVGHNIKAMLEGGLCGTSVLSVMGNLEPIYKQIMETGQGKTEEAEVKLRDNREIRYRRIFLPLGKSDVVDHIIGGMRYKVFPADESK